MDWTIPCKEAATLMVAREDRELALGERAAQPLFGLYFKIIRR